MTFKYIPTGICSYCKLGWNDCRCSQFHPNVISSTSEPAFSLGLKESRAIIEWVEKRVGYISHEFDEPIHEFLTKLSKFVKENR